VRAAHVCCQFGRIGPPASLSTIVKRIHALDAVLVTANVSTDLLLLWTVPSRGFVPQQSPLTSGTWSSWRDKRSWRCIMKRVFLTTALGMVCIAAFAQGTVNFANQGVGFAAPVYDAHGVACRNTFLADLFWGPGMISDSSLLTPLNASALFDFSTPGFFYGGTRTLPTAPNVLVTVQVRVWDVYSGASWYAASTVWGAMIGESILFQVNPADPSGTPTPLTGLSAQPQPWQLYFNIPEPSALALAGLGLAALLVLRRCLQAWLNYPAAANLATTLCCQAVSSAAVAYLNRSA